MDDFNNFYWDLISREHRIEEKFGLILERFEIDKDPDDPSPELQIRITKKLFKLFDDDLETEFPRLETCLNGFLKEFEKFYRSLDDQLLKTFYHKLNALKPAYAPNFLLLKTLEAIRKHLGPIEDMDENDQEPSDSEDDQPSTSTMRGNDSRTPDTDDSGNFDSSDSDEETGSELFSDNLKSLEKQFKKLSEQDRCIAKSAEFLRHYLDILLGKAISCSDDDTSSKLKTSIITLLECIYGVNLDKNVDITQLDKSKYDTLDWDVCKRLLRLFLPKNVHQARRSSQTYSPINIRVAKFCLPCIMDLSNDELRQRFDNYIREKLNSSYSNNNSKWSPVEDFLDGLPQVTDVSDNYKNLATRAVFVLAQNTHQNDPENLKDVLGFLQILVLLDKFWTGGKEFTAFCNLLIESLPNCSKELPVHDLFTLLDKCVNFLSMIILINESNVNIDRAHLELGLVMYSYCTNLRRYLAENPDDGEFNELSTKATLFLLRCKVHFKLASKSKDLSPDVKWPACYFLGKIAEKENAKTIKVLKHYQKCGHLMETCVGFRMFSHTANGETKCFDILYRIYHFLNKKRSEVFTAKDALALQGIVILLKFFSPNCKDPRTNDLSKCFLKMDLEQFVDEKMPDEITDSLEQLNDKALNLIKDHYLKFEARGNYYKKNYRLLQLYLDNGHRLNEAATEILEPLLSSHDRSVAYIFAGYSRDYGPYFKRHGSISFHIERFFNFTLDNFFNEIGLKKMLTFLNDTLFDYKNRRFQKFNIPNNCIEKLIKKLLDTCCNVLKESVSNDDRMEFTDYLDSLKDISNNLQGCQFELTQEFLSKIELHKASLLKELNKPIETMPLSPISIVDDPSSPAESNPDTSRTKTRTHFETYFDNVTAPFLLTPGATPVHRSPSVATFHEDVQSVCSTPVHVPNENDDRVETESNHSQALSVSTGRLVIDESESSAEDNHRRFDFNLTDSDSELNTLIEFVTPIQTPSHAATSPHLPIDSPVASAKRRRQENNQKCEKHIRELCELMNQTDELRLELFKKDKKKEEDYDRLLLENQRLREQLATATSQPQQPEFAVPHLPSRRSTTQTSKNTTSKNPSSARVGSQPVRRSTVEDVPSTSRNSIRSQPIRRSTVEDVPSTSRNSARSQPIRRSATVESAPQPTNNSQRAESSRKRHVTEMIRNPPLLGNPDVDMDENASMNSTLPRMTTSVSDDITKANKKVKEITAKRKRKFDLVIKAIKESIGLNSEVEQELEKENLRLLTENDFLHNEISALRQESLFADRVETSDNSNQTEEVIYEQSVVDELKQTIESLKQELASRYEQEQQQHQQEDLIVLESQSSQSLNEPIELSEEQPPENEEDYAVPQKRPRIEPENIMDGLMEIQQHLLDNENLEDNLRNELDQAKEQNNKLHSENTALHEKQQFAVNTISASMTQFQETENRIENFDYNILLDKTRRVFKSSSKAVASVSTCFEGILEFKNSVKNVLQNLLSSTVNENSDREVIQTLENADNSMQVEQITSTEVIQEQQMPNETTNQETVLQTVSSLHIDIPEIHQPIAEQTSMSQSTPTTQFPSSSSTQNAATLEEPDLQEMYYKICRLQGQVLAEELKRRYYERVYHRVVISNANEDFSNAVEKIIRDACRSLNRAPRRLTAQEMQTRIEALESDLLGQQRICETIEASSSSADKRHLSRMTELIKKESAKLKNEAQQIRHQKARTSSDQTDKNCVALELLNVALGICSAVDDISVHILEILFTKTYFEMKQYNHAVKHFERATRLGNVDANFYFLGAKAYDKLHQYEKAIDNLNRCLRRNNNHSEAKNFLITLETIIQNTK